MEEIRKNIAWSKVSCLPLAADIIPAPPRPCSRLILQIEFLSWLPVMPFSGVSLVSGLA